MLKEEQLIDGNVYYIIDKGREYWREAKWLKAYRVFLVDGECEKLEGCDKRIPIEDVFWIGEEK